MTRFLSLLIVALLALTAVAAHTGGGGDVYVRVVSGDPATRTYTFSCAADPASSTARDWFIRPDDGVIGDDPGEADFQDVPAGQYVTYTFAQDAFYHVACLVPDAGNLRRGDLHLDLRPSNGWNPEISVVSAAGLSATLRCDPASGATPAWEVLDVRTGAVMSLGSQNQITYSASGHGLYDFFCTADGNQVPLPVEFFDAGDPYFPDTAGVPHGVANTWVREGSGGGNDTGGGTNTSSFGLSRVDTDGGLAAVFACNPQGNSGDIAVDWNFGDGGILYDTGMQAPHTFAAAGTYAVQCDVWDNVYSQFRTLSKSFTIAADGGGSGGNGTGGGNTTNTTGIVRTDSDGGLAVDLLCNPEGDSGNLVVDWNFGDGSSEYDERADIGHTYLASGTYFVQCDAWDNSQARLYSLSRSLSVTNDGGGSGGGGGNGTGGNGTGGGTNTSAFGLVRVDTDGGLGAEYICNPEGHSGNILVDWNFGDGQALYDAGAQQAHAYASAGGYYVQCDAWDNVQSQIYSLSKMFTITTEGGGSGGGSGGGGGNGTGGACYSRVADIPATCEGGTITQDSNSGSCRSLTCSAPDGQVQVLACDKPDGASPQYFEMYKQAQSGATTPKVCLGAENCIEDNGWDRSVNYPVCTGTGGGTNGTGGFPAPVWYAPSDGLTGVAPDYFHLEMNPPTSGTVPASADYEVWTADMTQRVWLAAGEMGTYVYHVHTPDGAFEGPLAGQPRLAYSTSYETRVRYRAANGTYSPWSEWRTFTTKAEGAGGGGTGTSAWEAAPGFRVEKFATGFDVPVHVAAAPQLYGAYPESQRPFLYVTELYGQVKVVYRDGSQSTYAQDLLNFDPFGSITGGGQMGVIGLYVDDATGDLFVGMVYTEGDVVKNKVVRFFTSDDGRTFTGQQTVIDNLPSAPSHQVEQITKGPDGKLYVNLGDALNPPNAQSDSVLAGRIIRMNMDGSGVETYAKGFRNPFGADWRPGTGQLFVTDNAPDTGDRLVRVAEGTNYGWGMSDGGATFNAQRIATLNVSPVDAEFNPGGTGFPSELAGKLYVAVAGQIYQQGQTPGKHILEFTLDGAGNVASRREFVKYVGSGYGTPMGLDFASDGLYFTDIYGDPGFVGLGETEGNVYRVVQGEPGDGGETGPFRAGVQIAPWYPKDTGSGIEYVFACDGIDGSGSYLRDWDFGDGSKAYNYGQERIGPHTYPYGDTDYTVKCTVKDQTTGQSATAQMVINPSDYIPPGV